ncbi:hypothetical protein BLOT_010396 [Blomia tropicalis]|nr:hypothetical protein BLOT_010396 [Blomia tropicalis]
MELLINYNLRIKDTNYYFIIFIVLLKLDGISLLLLQRWTLSNNNQLLSLAEKKPNQKSKFHGKNVRDQITSSMYDHEIVSPLIV